MRNFGGEHVDGGDVDDDNVDDDVDRCGEVGAGNSDVDVDAGDIGDVRLYDDDDDVNDCNDDEDAYNRSNGHIDKYDVGGHVDGGVDGDREDHVVVMWVLMTTLAR